MTAFDQADAAMVRLLTEAERAEDSARHLIADFFPQSRARRRRTAILASVRRRQIAGLTSSDQKYRSLICLAMQLRLCAVRAFKVDVDFVAVEGERPPLHFAVPQDSSLHHKGVVVEPAAFDGVRSSTLVNPRTPLTPA
jgi:hypothetical protein